MRNHRPTTLECDHTGQPTRTEFAAPAHEVAPGQVLDLLGRALVAEDASRRRYARHSETASGALAPEVASELLQHADEKGLHVLQLTRLIRQLGGEVDPDAVPVSSRHVAQPCAREGLPDLIREDILAECVMQDIYLGMLRRPSDCGTPARGLLEDLLAIGEVQVMRLIRLLYELEPAHPDRRKRTARRASAARANGQLRGEAR
jgi:bacterioferritin